MKRLVANQLFLSKLVLSIAVMTGIVGSTIADAHAQHSPAQSGIQIAQADSWVMQVHEQLTQAAIALGLAGANLSHEPFYDALGHRGIDDITLTLKKGVSYSIVGVCDEDCRDIDLELFDNNGNRVALDIQYDDYPMVSVTPRRSATFTIRVRMTSCSNGPCRYGVGVFGR
jgi:hypothetical protein